MEDQPTQRRLVAVLIADIAGYTRLMEQDTDGTVAAWQTARQEVIKPVIADHSGKIVKLTGDGFLVEFSTIQNAVNCAIVMQRGLAPSSLDFRIGINLGDIVDDGEDIHGEGVNIAARLEGLADPGGICISGDVYNQVRNRIEATFEDLGKQKVKNVAEPVRAYRIVVRNEDVGSAAVNTGEPPPLPDKPSIAVLPFVNMSDDPKQEYFSDGITEDLITDLSKVSGLFVVARNSTFVYKGRAADIKQVARDLGVRYVLEGSVRRGGEKVRINAQLIDAATGNHLWAERYDGDLKDIFALQDQITESIVATLAVTLTRVEQDRAMRKKAVNMQAYDYVLRGNAYHHRMTREDNVKAKENFSRAIKLDPDYAPTYAGLAWVLIHDFNQWGADREKSLNQALEYAKRAVLLDDSLAKAHMVLGDVYLWTKQHDQAIVEGRKAIALDPSYADAHFALCVYLYMAGHAEEALEEGQKALRFNPVHAHRLYYQALGRAHYMLKQYDAAVEAGEQAVSRDPNNVGPHLSLAAAYAQMGRMDNARRHAQEALSIDPAFSLQAYAKRSPFKNKSDLDHSLDGLRKAGLPE
jgi:adenylate cyclase